jgi:DNA-binding HxlR family transcriptional regulator/putative sterol carrier protein
VRSYKQYCALARALDVIGDRWTLLIVRELLIRKSCRYTDLRNGLPGIATNLLADRLRDLEEAGLVRREEAPPPIATTLFQLTSRGEELEPILMELGRWGAPLLAKAARTDAFCTHWLSLPLKLHLVDEAPEGPPITIELRTGDEPMTIRAADGTVTAQLGPAHQADAVLSGSPQLVLGLLAGKLDLGQARLAGMHFEGDSEILRRVRLRTGR